MRLLRPLILLGLLASLVMLAGCPAKVQTEPFAKFQTTVNTVAEKVDDVSLEILQEKQDAILESYVENTAEIEKLYPTFVGKNPFVWEYNDLLLTKYEKTQAGLERLNTAFIAYAAALNQIASTSYLSQDDADSMASTINTLFNSAFELLSNTPTSIPTEIISLIAAESLKNYAEAKKRSALEQSIKENREKVEKYCNYVSLHLKYLASQIKQQSVESRKKHNTEYNKMVEASKNQEEIKKVFNLKYVMQIHADQTLLTQRLSLLESMAMTYKSLPAAHANLLAEDKATPLAAINTLLTNALRMQAKYEALKAETAQATQ